MPARNNPIQRTAFSINEVAATLGIGRRTVYELLNSGRLRAVRIGSRQRIPAEEITRLMAAPERASIAVVANPTPVPQAAVAVEAALPRTLERPSLSQLIAAANARRRISAD